MSPKAARKIVYSAGRSIEEVRRQYGLKRIIKLASNENNWGLSGRIISRFCRVLHESYRYPETNYTDLRTAIAAKFGVKTEAVVTGNGSDEVLSLLFDHLTPPSSEALIPAPSYQLYRILLNNFGRKYREIPLKGWDYDLDRFLKAVNARTGMIVLCNPNNPTGTYITAEKLEAFLKKLPRRVWVIVDEAYADFADAPDFGQAQPLMARFPNLIVCRTFSKLFCLAGLRLGYAFVPPKAADIYNYYRPPFSVNKLVERSGFLFEESGYFEKLTGRILKDKEKLYDGLAKLGVWFVRTQTNFVFIHGLADSKAVFESLLSKGVIVRELSSFGIRGGLRVTIGKPEENAVFLKEFSALLKNRPVS